MHRAIIKGALVKPVQKHLLRKLASLKVDKRQSLISKGFTLVELIVVVVIIGVLSSIAVPAFNNASDKAKQKEASAILASYVKAAQAFNAENSSSPRYARDLGQFVSISACRRGDGPYCKTQNNAQVDLTNSTATNWYTPSGLYRIYWRTSGYYSQFRAVPWGQYANSGYGVSACFNRNTGATKVLDQTQKGQRYVRDITC